jgi:hypothetical protein
MEGMTVINKGNEVYGPLTISGAREYSEGYPVELVREPKTGRMSILARNEGGNNVTLVDLWDVIDWLQLGPIEGKTEGGFAVADPMSTILGEIQKALDAGLHYLAVASALSLPDVCAALESPTGTTSGAQYKAWYDAWLAPLYPNITGDDIYSLRCGVVHQGRFGHPKMQYSRVLFTIPNASRNVFHNNILDDALNLDAPTFCKDIIASVMKWYEAKKTDPAVEVNLPRLLRLHPNGLPPYMVGMPLIA